MSHNLLLDPLIRVRYTDGSTEAVSLPDVYPAMLADRVAGFPALRSHQRHAWHAFLAQLGVIALHRAGRGEPPAAASGWRTLLRGMTAEFANDEPWHLIVDNPALPAFMQCPAPGLGDYRSGETTPDDLDVLYNAKNHCPKRAVAVRHAPDDWIFALISLQTTPGFQGGGHYGIARINGGFSARSCVGFVPARGGVGAHLGHDMRGMIECRDSLVARYRFPRDGGLALLWLHSWDGRDALALRSLDPYFIEICRRVRLRESGSGVLARTASSKGRRIDAEALRGVVGDFWTPVSDEKAPRAFSLSWLGFQHDRIRALLLENTWRLPPAMVVDPSACERWRLVARGVAGGQGRTSGYHERTDLTFASDTVKAMLGGNGRRDLEAIAKAFGEDIKQVFAALRFGVTVGAAGGRESDKFTDLHRARADFYATRLQKAIDARFFPVLEARFRARGDERMSASVRNEFLRGLLATALRLLEEATATTHGSALLRQRATARSLYTFWAMLRRRASILGDETMGLAVGRDEDEGGDETVVVTGGVRFDVRDLSRQIAGLQRYQVNALSRGPLAVAAFWQLVRQATTPATVRDVDNWAALIQALAILTRKRTPHPFTYAPARSMGAALFDAGVSELWLARLLAARGQRRRDLMIRTCYRLTAARRHRFDLRRLARFLLVADDETDRRIAREYYETDATVAALRKGTGADG